MPGGRILLSPKAQGETCFTSSPFDFISCLQQGETILTFSVGATVYSGTDTNPSAILSGTPTVVNGTQVRQLTTGGVNGVTYELDCTVTTSLGQTLIQTGLLSIYSTPVIAPTSGFPFGTGELGVTSF